MLMDRREPSGGEGKQGDKGHSGMTNGELQMTGGEMEATSEGGRRAAKNSGNGGGGGPATNSGGREAPKSNEGSLSVPRKQGARADGILEPIVYPNGVRSLQ